MLTKPPTRCFFSLFLSPKVGEFVHLTLPDQGSGCGHVHQNLCHETRVVKYRSMDYEQNWIQGIERIYVIPSYPHFPWLSDHLNQFILLCTGHPSSYIPIVSARSHVVPAQSPHRFGTISCRQWLSHDIRVIVILRSCSSPWNSDVLPTIPTILAFFFGSIMIHQFKQVLGKVTGPLHTWPRHAAHSWRARCCNFFWRTSRGRSGWF